MNQTPKNVHAVAMEFAHSQQKQCQIPEKDSWHVFHFPFHIHVLHPARLLPIINPTRVNRDSWPNKPNPTNKV